MFNRYFQYRESVGNCKGKFFLYTKGKEEKSGQKISDMLKYIEKITNNNATGQQPQKQDIKSIYQLVERVKQKKVTKSFRRFHLSCWQDYESICRRANIFKVKQGYLLMNFI